MDYHQGFQQSGQRIPHDEWQKRLRRLEQLVKTLYYVTDRDSADRIQQSGEIMHEKSSKKANGYYFFSSADDAMGKARGNGKEVLITCRVRLGNIKTMRQHKEFGLTFSVLFDEGYDSVLILSDAAAQHVVYKSDQVDILEIKVIASGKILFEGDSSVQRRHTFREQQNTNGNARNGNFDAHRGSVYHQSNRERSRNDPRWSDRQQRLETRGQQKVMYYLATEEIADRIVESHKLQRNNGGIAGPGIYFHTSFEQAQREMSGRTKVLITCRVKLGNVKQLYPCGDESITFTSLYNQGYDSVCVPGPQGDLFVVYNFDQAEVLEVKNFKTKTVLDSSSDDEDNTQLSSTSNGGRLNVKNGDQVPASDVNLAFRNTSNSEVQMGDTVEKFEEFSGDSGRKSTSKLSSISKVNNSSSVAENANAVHMPKSSICDNFTGQSQSMFIAKVTVNKKNAKECASEPQLLSVSKSAQPRRDLPSSNGVTETKLAKTQARQNGVDNADKVPASDDKQPTEASSNSTIAAKTQSSPAQSDLRSTNKKQDGGGTASDNGDPPDKDALPTPDSAGSEILPKSSELPIESQSSHGENTTQKDESHEKEPLVDSSLKETASSKKTELQSTRKKKCAIL